MPGDAPASLGTWLFWTGSRGGWGAGGAAFRLRSLLCRQLSFSRAMKYTK